MIVSGGRTISSSAQIQPGVVETTDLADGAVTNDKVNAAAAIVDTKLATISTAGKVSGAALTSLASVPAGAGVLPAANAPAITNLQQALTAGDPLTAGEAVAVSDGSTQTVLAIATAQVGEANFGRTTLRLKQREDLAANAALVPFNRIKVTMRKVGSPVDNVLVKCWALDGTTLIATGTIDGSTLTTTLAEYTFTLDVPGTKLTRFIELSRSGADNDTNHYAVGLDAADAGYAGGTCSRWDGSVWTSENTDMIASLTKVVTAGQAIMASAKLAAWVTTYIGFANATAAAGASVTVNLAGAQSGLSGLTAGVGYYLADIGGTIATTAGTVSRKVAVAISTTIVKIADVW